MDIFLAIASYVIVWWLAFFVVLPIGAHSAHEAGEAVQQGVEPGAPKAHRLGVKALWATGLAAIVWLIALWALPDGVFSLVR